MDGSDSTTISTRALRARRWTWLWAGLAILAAAAPLPSADGGRAPTRLAIVINAARPETDVSLAQLRRIYLGDRRFWGDGTPVHGVLPPQESPELIEAFLRQTIGLPPDEFWRHWSGMVFRGLNNRRPRSLATAPATLRAVFRSKIPIALIPVDQLPDGDVGLRVLTIDGKSHVDPDYPLELVAAR